MKYHVLTLFPEMIQNGMKTSITGRAIDQGILSLNTVDIRLFSMEKHGKVDDYPYGGGAGMVMQADPVYRAFLSLDQAGHRKGRNDLEGDTEYPKAEIDPGSGKIKGAARRRVIYMTPQGKVFNQKMAQEFAREEELILLCGHYEGIDERVLEDIVTDYVSIGDYVLTGGELPAMVLMDAVSRLVPGVLNNKESAETETFDRDLLEYPQYSRPELWHGKAVPEVLLSGDHKKIETWRMERSLERTAKVRPDLYDLYEKKQHAIRLLRNHKRLHIHMMEALRRGLADLLYQGEDGVLLCVHNVVSTYMLTTKDVSSGRKILKHVPPSQLPDLFVNCQEFMNDVVKQYFGFTECNACYQADYSQRTKLPERMQGIQIAVLKEKELAFVEDRYDLASREQLRERIGKGCLYGAWDEETGKIIGFAGFHEEGSMGFLTVEEPYRNRGIGTLLESFLINRSLERGEVPYCNLFDSNVASMGMQRKLGLNIAKERLYWLARE